MQHAPYGVSVAAWNALKNTGIDIFGTQLVTSNLNDIHCYHYILVLGEMLLYDLFSVDCNE